MRDKLDAEKLGIILLSSFMDEFFPEDERSNHPDVFKVYHYNGQPQSNPDSKVFNNKFLFEKGYIVELIYCVL